MAKPPQSRDRESGWLMVQLRAWAELIVLLLIAFVCVSWLWQARAGRGAAAAPGLMARSSRAPAPRPEPTVPADPISLDGAQLLGNKAAPLVLLAYSDFQCPYCGKFARETMPEFRRSYVDTGKVLLAFRELPLEAIHPLAFKAAEAAECAGRQGQFWAMHDVTFADQRHLDDAALREHAKAAHADPARFAACVASAEIAAKVKADEKTAEALDVSGTPTFFLGVLDSQGRLRTARRFSGAQTPLQLSAMVETLLATRAKSGK